MIFLFPHASFKKGQSLKGNLKESENINNCENDECLLAPGRILISSFTGRCHYEKLGLFSGNRILAPACFPELLLDAKVRVRKLCNSVLVQTKTNNNNKKTSKSVTVAECVNAFKWAFW